MSNPTAEFRGELKSLRDQVLAAIDRASIGDVEDGLELYGRLATATLRTFNDLRQQTELQPNSSWFNPYGQEMEWLETDIQEFIDRTFASFNDGVFKVVLRFLMELLTDFWESKELGAHRRFLGITQQAYWDSLNLPAQRSDPAGSILISVRSHAAYRLARGRPQFDDAIVRAALDQVIDFLFESLRLALQRSRTAAERCILEIHELQEDLGFANDPERSRPSHSVAIADTLERLHSFALGTAGYLLLLNDESKLDDESTVALFDQVSSLLPVGDLWTALVEADEDRGRAFPWSNWEMDIWPKGQRSGFLGRLRTSMNEAVAVRLIAGGLDRSDERSLENLEPSQAAWTVQTALETVEPALVRYKRLWPERGSTDATSLRSSLAALQAQFEEKDQEARHRLELIPARIDAFLNAAEAHWLERSALRSAVAEEVSSENSPDEIFGHSSLVPKDFFTGSHAYGDPADVGRNLAGALARGESIQIIETLDGAGRSEVQLTDLREQVSAQLQVLRLAGHSPSIIAVNSWRTVHELTGSYGPGTFAFDGAAVAVDYAGEIPLCIVADLSEAVRLRRWTMTVRAAEDQLRADDLLLGGIRDVTDEFATELVEGNENFRRSENGTLMSVDEATKKLRNRVAAKLFCKFSIELVDPTAAHVFAVAEDG
jgi:hypothetical protein